MRQDAASLAELPGGASSAATASNTPRIAVIIASKGRPQEISYVLQALSRQTLPPTAIVLSVASETDIPFFEDPSITTIIGTSGLTRQRNRGLEEVLTRSDIVVFFDDDFIPANNSLAGMADLFAANPDIAGASGFVIQDGVTNGGLNLPDALACLNDFQASPPPSIRTRDQGWAYGCNMAFRASAVGNIRFDENLPLYGWQEDVDFSMQMRRRGRIVWSNAFAGVHLGVNKSRSSGISLGYSQMINPVYLARKGSVPPFRTAIQMARNFLANHWHAISPEPWIDRRGRVRGNWRGILHLLRGKADPNAILRF